MNTESKQCRADMAVGRWVVGMAATIGDTDLVGMNREVIGVGVHDPITVRRSLAGAGGHAFIDHFHSSVARVVVVLVVA